MNSSSPTDGFPLYRTGRVLLGLWSLFLVCGFSVAASLDPDPKGFGTHRQLGLPPCSFSSLTGLPCPSCGMTTSFSHFVRGQWFRSAQANTTGFCLAFACAVQIPWCWFSIWKRRLWRVDRPETALLYLIVTLYVIGLAEWAVRYLQT